MSEENTPQAFARRRAIARQNVDKLGIKYEELPQLPFFAPFFGHTYSSYKFEIADVIVNASALLGRGLTPTERDVIAYMSAKKAVTESYEPPISMLAAIYMERRGRAASKFPFYTPKPTTFDPSFFPYKSAPMLHGPAALITWNAVRFGCYAFVAHFIGGIFFSSYATSVQTAALMRDPRLADLRKGFADRRHGKKPADGQAAAPWEKPEDPSMKDTETPYGSFSEEGAPEKPTRTFEQPRGKPARSSGTTGAYPPVPQSVPAQGTTPAQSQDFMEGSVFEDDASPVAPAARGGNAAASSSSGGSAWERLRQQAKSNPAASQGTARPRTYGQPAADQYSYSQEDADRSTAKDQAQKEFDAMLEKERRGETDNQARRW